MTLVIDTNIIIRAVLGRRVFVILSDYQSRANFRTPDSCVVEAQRHLPALIQKRRYSVEEGTALFEATLGLIEIVDSETYGIHESAARKRLRRRDENDWPVLATALALDCPIWTEDPDFFGTGVPVWTTDRVELFLNPRST